MPNKIFKYTIYWYPTSNQNYNCLVMQPLGILPLYFPDIFENYLRFSFCIPFPLTLVFLPSFICKCIFSHISRGFSLLTWLAPPPPLSPDVLFAALLYSLYAVATTACMLLTSSSPPHSIVVAGENSPSYSASGMIYPCLYNVHI